jgi:hypothetical protein
MAENGKLPQQMVDYRGRELEHENCGECKYRVENGEEPATCTLMEGTVDPEHVCDLFEARNGGNRHSDVIALELRTSLPARQAGEMGEGGAPVPD